MSLFTDNHTKLALIRSGVSEIDANSLLVSLASIPGALDKVLGNIIKYSKLYQVYMASISIGKPLYEHIDLHIWNKLLARIPRVHYTPGKFYDVKGTHKFKAKTPDYIIEVEMRDLKTQYVSKWQHNLVGGKFKIRVWDKYELRVPIHDKTHHMVIELDADKRFMRFALRPSLP